MSLYWSIHCRDCFNCKQKTIKSQEELESFIERKENIMRKGWPERLQKNKSIDFYWCGLERNCRLRTTIPGMGMLRVQNKFCAFMDN